MFFHSVFNKRTRSHKRVNNSERLNDVLFQMIDPELTIRDIFFFCIGSDQINGDRFGPAVGSILKQKNYDNVIGTIDDPVDAKNLVSRLQEIPADRVTIAIDAGLGLSFEIGTYYIYRHSIQPGLGVGHQLPEVGDYGILGVVNELDYKEGIFYTPPSLVNRMAENLACSLMSRFPN
jgi:putative sporulation protein YyaC